ncbi:methanogenesis marker 2 protein [Methanolapillus ohkumae]|uniref:Thiamine-monophosphate kinase n=1 Tax=Methanolapillus ohkumae TaxID=3028298 RepID=A0AA96ZVZ6_9EURY|nr:Thiamine-monophosphate kinase [Methanosarcinaceae archaeon Am2]
MNDYKYTISKINRYKFYKNISERVFLDSQKTAVDFNNLDLEALAKTIRSFEGVSRKKPITQIAEIFESVSEMYNGCVVDFGDDAAAIDIGGGDVILLAADGIWGRLIEKSPWWAGFTSVLANVNDIVAMGGKPLAMVDVVSSSQSGEFSEIFRGMAEGVKKFGVPVVGGHTHPEGAASLSVAIIGIAKKEELIRSDTAKPGDIVIFAVDLDGRTGPNSPYSFESLSLKSPAVVRKMYEAPQILGKKRLVTAGKDISNPGLIGTLGMLVETSGVGAIVDLTKLPMPNIDLSIDRWLLMHPGTGFVFTAKKENADAVIHILKEAGIFAAAAGEIMEIRTLEITAKNKSAVVFDFEKDKITGICKK